MFIFKGQFAEWPNLKRKLMANIDFDIIKSITILSSFIRCYPFLFKLLVIEKENWWYQQFDTLQLIIIRNITHTTLLFNTQYASDFSIPYHWNIIGFKIHSHLINTKFYSKLQLLNTKPQTLNITLPSKY